MIIEETKHLCPIVAATSSSATASPPGESKNTSARRAGATVA